jgi:hypothetical protein
MNLRDSSCADYRPDDRVRTGHLTGDADVTRL